MPAEGEKAQKPIASVGRAKSIRRTYILALLIIALAGIGSFLISYHTSEVFKNNEVAVNLAGRQRMLSQRMLAQVLMTERSESVKQREELTEAIQRNLTVFIRVHRGLRQGDEELELEGGGSQETLAIYDKVQVKHQLLVESISRYLANGSQSDISVVSEIIVSAEGFLPLMDKLVYSLVDDFKEHSDSLELLKLILLGALIIVLTFVSLILFEPLVKYSKKLEEENEIGIAQLGSARKRLELALDATGTGLWDWNLLTDETYFNDSWYTMLGYEPGELPMNLNSWMEICDPDDLEIAKEKINEYFEGGSDIYRCEQRIKCKDGSWLWIEDIGRIVEHDAQGNASRMIGVHVDIQRQKQYQEDLVEAKNEALRANRAKSEFLASMSHELRTPMNSIIGFTRRLLKKCSEVLPQREFDALETIDRNAKHLLNLINDILDLSKIEAGKMDLNRSHFELVGLAETVLSSLEPIVSSKGIELRKNFPAETCNVLADNTKIRQILTNVISNAIKYTDAGSVDVSIELRSQNAVSIIVKDTGLGIKAENLERLFSKFTQLDLGEQHRRGGTGLGLAITKEYVEMHGGEIKVASRWEEGSEFSIYLPIVLEQRGEIEQEIHTTV